MEERSPSSSNTTDKAESSSGKQAACLNCRRSKTRCLKDGGDLKCKKCSQTLLDCVIPEYRVGRKKGIKNKRDGLEKAVYRIEQAIKRHKSDVAHQSDDGPNIQRLQGLLNDAQKFVPLKAVKEDDSKFSLSLIPDTRPPKEISASSPDVLPGPESIADANSDDHFAVADAENPLQLLARASDLSFPAQTVADVVNTCTSTRSTLPSITRPRVSGDPVLRDFFGPLRPSLDNTTDIDPIDMGLVTEEEAIALFIYFNDNLSHTRWGLDPVLHTPKFVRKQSAFLFTSIIAASALFIPSATSLHKRLSAHCSLLAHKIMQVGNRSPEIVLAFMINVPWMPPGKHWSDDETCSYVAAAVTCALDMSLDKSIIPSPSDIRGHSNQGRTQSGCINARKALELDGFPEVDPFSDFGRRLLRRRERIWLALFILDRGVCLARGRSFIVPVTPIIQKCEDWHRCLFADRWDGCIVSSAVLRRDLVNVISEVQRACDDRAQNTSGMMMVQSLQQMVDGFFNCWYATWAFAIGGTKDKPIPPYVDILVTHGRLSIYSSVINHPSAPIEVKRYFRTAGLSSSLNVMRAAVQGESSLKSMPNNTCIMISFAACFAIYLSIMGAESLAPSIRRLIEESAGVLERIGRVTKQRNGTSALYGRHLREVVGSTMTTNPPNSLIPQHSPPSTQIQTTYLPPNPNVNTLCPPLYHHHLPPSSRPITRHELLRFSAMSDDQINEAISNSGEDFNFEWAAGGLLGGSRGTILDERTGLDWLNWFNMDVSGQ